MIYHILKKLAIYRNEQEFYQIGCIALWEASLRFEEEKGEFKSYAYSYIIGRMKSELSNERKLQENSCQLELVPNQEEIAVDDFTQLISGSFIESITSRLSQHQSKWLKAYCLYGKTPTEIAIDEGVTTSAVKAWRRDAIAKLKRLSVHDLLR
ncbi:MAG: sigma-70 family RNA polymerase sigma factor [Bacillota bacterium]